MIARRVLLSGCSGGGKSTLLDDLARARMQTVPEPGRRIVAAATGPDDPALPWNDLPTFLHRAAAMAVADHAAAGPGLTLFDRGLPDAACGFARLGPLPAAVERALGACRYETVVYMVPPWPEIFRADAARRHGFDAAVEEYRALCHWLPLWGYALREVPRLPRPDRALWLRKELT